MFVKQLTKSRRIDRLFFVAIIVLLNLSTILSQGDGLSCIGAVNLSIDERTCSTTVAANMIVNPSDYDATLFNYEVFITDIYGTPVSSTIGIESLGETFKAGARATNISTGLVSNVCWSYVTVEYKFVPDISCETSYVVSCLADPANYPGPVIMSPLTGSGTICGAIPELRQVGLDRVENICDPTRPDTVAKITRSYQAVNTFGGFSNICEVEYYVTAFKLSEVVFPTVATIGSCSDEDFLTAPENLGIPYHLSITGSGTGSVQFDTTYLYPTPPSACNILVSLENDTISQDNCEIKVLRKWTIQQWLCNNEERIAEREQLVTLRDLDGPAFVCPTDTIRARASSTSCRAFVNMPKLDVDDSCSEVTSVSMAFFPEGSLNSNGGTISLPVGIQKVEYRAKDACNTESTCEVIVKVTGDAPPVVICEQHVSISLTSNGTAHVPANAFDDGSYGCGFKNVLIAKMGPDICGDTEILNPEFDTHIKFCCIDALSPQMVRLRAYNHDGSYNECMAEVTINDKNPVSLVCPPDIEVSCEFIYDDNLEIFGSIATSEEDRESIVIDAAIVVFNGGSTSGRDGLATGGCDMAFAESTNIEASTLSCGTGSIKRTFTISNDNDTRSCTQTIRITGANNFDGVIVWPKDTTLDVACRVGSIDPDETGRPIFTAGDCQQLAASYVDETFTNVEIDGTCRKIFRYWTIVDWCNSDAMGFPNKYPEANNGRYLQVIKVVKNEKPFVSCVRDTTFESVESSCLVSGVSLTASVAGCPNSTEYKWEYFLDLDCNSSIDSVGNANTYAETVRTGTHCITWYATDLCGNISNACVDTFVVRNNKGPSAVCISNLTVTLDSMDASGDGIADTVMQMLEVDKVDSGSSQSCGNPFTLSFSRDAIVGVITFNCAQLGAPLDSVGLFVHDDVTGNVSECWALIDVQDPCNRCTGGDCPTVSMANVSGLLTTESGENISKADVSLLGSELPDNTTNDSGQYAFNSMPMGGAYTVMAQKNKDHINGVSTLDLVMIQKHILGLDLLDSPYKMIAADINKSNNISAADIVELRKLILGEQSEYVNNTSWRFVDKEYGFVEASNPWFELFPEEYDISSLDQNMNVDFVGVKIGDVSGNASASDFNIAEVRNSSEALDFISTIEKDDASNSILFKISSSNFEEVSGFQTTLRFDPSLMSFEDVQSDNISISLENIGTAQAERGLITLSWSSADEVTLSENKEVLALVFKVKAQGAKDLTVTSELTNTEAYFNGNITDKITLDSKTVLGLSVAQNKPNPWKDQTDIKFEISENGYVGFNVIDLSGKLVLTKSNYFNAGENKIQLERSDLPSGGLYFYELYSQGHKVTKKMIVLD